MSDPGSLLKIPRDLTYSTKPDRLLYLLRDLREIEVCMMLTKRRVLKLECLEVVSKRVVLLFFLVNLLGVVSLQNQ